MLRGFSKDQISLADKENVDAKLGNLGMDELILELFYSMTWIAPVGHWHSQALQTRHSSTLTGEDFASLTS